MTDITPTARSRLKRHHERGAYDLDTIAAILDAAFLCHVGYVIDGQPYVTPTSYWRDDDVLYWHGSSASRMLRTLETGIACCFTVTIVDGLVLAGSAFNHSVNDRSVMLFGRASVVEETAERYGSWSFSRSACIPAAGPSCGQSLRRRSRPRRF